MMRLFLCSLLLFFFQGCSSETPPSSFHWQTVNGRIDHNSPLSMPVYRMRVPADWVRKDFPASESADTTQSLCEFLIREGSSEIKIAIHNFPSDKMEERIPPLAQITRWQNQFQAINPEEISVKPQAFSGFSGLLFQGSGLLKDQPMTILGWSMQISPLHYQTLSYPSDEKAYQYRQMRADFTIKVTGPTPLIQKHLRSLMAFARSFELIEDIPSR